MSATVVGTVLSRSEWESRAEAHRARVAPQVTGVIERRARGEKHPVEDFLFHYYNLRPRRLEQWHPGVGVVLEDAESRASLPFQRRVARGMTLDVEAFLAKRGATVREAGRLLAASSAATPRFGCFGMHEWAMVYRLSPGETRHPYLKLRFPPEEVAAIVEEVGCRCSHFDAFRFFTPPARPLNLLTPTRERQAELDQPGCLHVNMDLYKWAGKLLPAVDSELLFDTFLSRARSARSTWPPPPTTCADGGLNPSESRPLRGGHSTQPFSAGSPPRRHRCGRGCSRSSSGSSEARSRRHATWRDVQSVVRV